MLLKRAKTAGVRETERDKGARVERVIESIKAWQKAKTRIGDGEL
jgi:hypothetical protein